MNSGARKLLMLRRFGLTARNFSDHHGPPEGYKHLVQLTMNNGYPIPSKTYAEVYKKLQAKNNKLLAFGVLFFAASVAFVYSQNTFGYLAPPPRKVLNWQ